MTTFCPVCGFVDACASFRSVPVRTVFPSSSRNSSIAVLPMVLIAASGSLTPGSSMMTRRSPSRWMIGSVRPSALTRFSMIATTRFIASSLTCACSVSTASRTTCVPPCRSSPCRMELASGRTHTKKAAMMTATVITSFNRLCCLNSLYPSFTLPFRQSMLRRSVRIRSTRASHAAMGTAGTIWKSNARTRRSACVARGRKRS